MKRLLTHSPYSTVLVLILILTFSFMYAPLVTSQDACMHASEEIISKLMELQEDVSTLPLDEAFENPYSAKGQRKALTNKIKAVINQIEAGASKGAINKLTNDLKNTIEAWITEDYEVSLIEKVDEIIRLIKGEMPPPFPDFSIEASPTSLTIAQGESNSSTITITSLNGFSELVNLTFSGVPSDVNVTLNPEQVTPPADGKITSTLTIEVAETATPNTYVLALAGTSGDLQHSASLSLEITKAPPPPDVEPPTVRIEEPENGSYLAGIVDIVVFMYDENFKRAELTINDTLIALWTPENVSTGEHSIPWDTTLSEYLDGSYNISLSAEDEAGNNAEVSITIFVDNSIPTAEIRQPLDDAYVKDIFNVIVYGYDADFLKMELYISDALAQAWTTGGEYTYVWNTSELSDGSYTIKLLVSDKASNSAEKQLDVTVDNTQPTAVINTPAGSTFLRGTVSIEVTGDDANFEETELRINGIQVESWTEAGSQIYSWSTKAYSDGSYTITLTVYDKAGNNEKTSITTVVDNTAPLIEAPSWEPEEPSVDTPVNIAVKVSDVQPGSGIQSVTLWYTNTTMDNWQSISMILDTASGKWTATIPAQTMETTIEFFIEALDNAGNKAETAEDYEYNVIAPTGIPLAWIIVIILLILAATIAAVYFWRKRRREKQDISDRGGKNYKLTILLCF